MKSFVENVEAQYKSQYKNMVKLYKNVSIYPKDILAKRITDFTKEERDYLTRKGFQWYVRFQYLHPVNKTWERFKVYSTINSDYPRFDKRYIAIHNLRKAVIKELELGRSPYDVTMHQGEVVTMEKVLDYVLEQQEPNVAPSTFKSYEYRIGMFKRWLEKKKLLNVDTDGFPYPVINTFLKDVAKESSASNRNNVLIVLKRTFKLAFKAELVPENYMLKIDKVKVPRKHSKPYTEEELTKIHTYLEENDPQMLLFVKFISSAFLRPVEVCRLRVKDINLKKKELRVPIKQGKHHNRRLPNDIAEMLEGLDLSKYKPDHFICTPKGVGKWDRDEEGRRNYHTQRFGRHKKKLGFIKGHDLYSFRHTFITLGYKNLIKRLSVDEALDELRKYTGHESREAMQGYIHEIDADIVDEYDGIVK